MLLCNDPQPSWGCGDDVRRPRYPALRRPCLPKLNRGGGRGVEFGNAPFRSDGGSHFRKGRGGAGCASRRSTVYYARPPSASSLR
eukprot:scaffold35211_cov68-Phaeocystis_antarctica.AAC.3